LENILSTVDFEYLNLAEVNPEVPPVPEGEYNFRIVEAKRESFTYKQDQPDRGIAAGDEGNYIKFGLVIIDNPEQAGRRIYQSLWPDTKTPRFLRLIADATGVAQTGTFDDWLQELTNARATFAAPTYLKTNKKTEKVESQVRFGSAKPVA
jgi:hypothetical protein